MILKIDKYDNLIEFCNKDVTLHTFCFDMINYPNVEVYISLHENDTVGYLIFRDQYTLINLTALVQENDVINFCSLIQEDDRSITANEYTYRRLKCHIGFNNIKFNHIATLEKLETKLSYTLEAISNKDLNQVNELRNICFPNSINVTIDNNDQRKSYDYLIKDNKQIIFVTQATKSGPSIMIMGVCTHPEFRNNGYATKGVIYQCSQILKDNKIPVLFYTDEVAAKIYLSLGFKPKPYIYCMFSYTKNL